MSVRAPWFIVSCALLLSACAVSQTSTKLAFSEVGPDSSYSYPVFNHTVALYLSDNFKKFTLKHQSDTGGITDSIQVELGKDMAKVLPQFFINRYQKVVVLNSLDGDIESIDYLFIPDIYHSQIEALPGSSGNSEVFALDLNLKLKVFKGDSPHDTVHASEMMKFSIQKFQGSTENQFLAQKQYDQLLSKAFHSIDTYLFNVMNPDCM